MMGRWSTRATLFGAVVMTNSDRGNELYDAIIPLIGRREGWPGY